MTREEYLKQRQEMLDKAEDNVKIGNISEFETIKAQIEALDESYKAESKAQADLAALSDNAIAAQENALKGIVSGVKTEALDKTADYETAFTKFMMGEALNADEQAVFNQSNSTSDVNTKNNTYLVPTTWIKQIWSEAEESHPILADVSMTSVPGDLDIPTAEFIGNAEFYDEEDTIADPEKSVNGGTIHLTGYELARTVSVSWKMQKMAVADFQPWLRRKIAGKMSEAMANAHLNGLGVASGLDSFKSQPLGVITALKKEIGTPQILDVADGTEITYESITYLISLVKSAYAKNAKFYANNTFIWRVLSNIADKNGRAIFIPDPTGQTLGKLFGYTVVQEAAVPDNTLVFGNFKEGYVGNKQQDIALYTQDNIRPRKTDYMAYTIYDAKPLTTKAFAMLVKETT